MDSSFLTGKNVVVTGTLPGLTDNVGLIRLNLSAEENGINISGIETDKISPDNAGDVIISPDSLVRGSVH